MIDFNNITDSISGRKRELERLGQEIYNSNQELKRIEEQLRTIDRFREISLNPAYENELLATKVLLETSVQDKEEQFTLEKTGLDEALQSLASVDPTVLVENLDDNIPILLLPLRVETKFLKVRSKVKLPKPAVQVEPQVLRTEGTTQVILDQLNGMISAGKVNPETLTALATQFNDVFNLISPITQLTPFEKQRLDNALSSIEKQVAIVNNDLDRNIATLQAELSSVESNINAFVTKRTKLSNNINRIKLLVNPLINLPIGNLTANLLNSLTQLETTLQNVNQLSYVDLSQVISSQLLVAADLDSVNVKSSLITGLLSTIQINSILAVNTRVEAQLQQFTALIENIKAQYTGRLTSFIDTRTLLNTEFIKIITRITTITVIVAEPPQTTLVTSDELWVRVYPDDIAIDDHEKSLTQNEYDSGKNYWDEVWENRGSREIELGLWRALVNIYGSPRTAYIVKTLTPSNYKILVPNQRLINSLGRLTTSVETVRMVMDRVPIEPVISEQAGGTLTSSLNELSSSLTGVTQILPEESELLKTGISSLQTLSVDIVDTIADSGPDVLVDTVLTGINTAVQTQINFLTTFVNTVQVVNQIDQTNYNLPPIYPTGINTKNESWSLAPVTRVMPDRIVVSLYKNNQKAYEVVGNAIADTLTVGINPNDQDEYFETDENGDFTFNPNIKWMHDFEDAVKVGMAVRIKITEEEANPTAPASGFDKLTVLGIKAGSNADSSRQMLEQLFDSHHYTGRGLKLIPQGTATNNTDKKSAGFLSQEIDPESTFKVERFGAQYINTNNLLSKTDGQWLVEALGVGDNTFQNISNSNDFDLRDAIAMNMALWQGTMGAYLEEMFDKLLTVKDIKTIRKFFVEFVKGRGTLPTLQIGEQPYGILTATAYSRLNLKVPFNKLDTLANDEERFLQKMKQLIVEVLGKEWTNLANANVRTINDFTNSTGDSISNSQAGLINLLGLHPSSEEFYQRYSAGQGYSGDYNSLINTAKQGATNSTWNQAAWQNLVNQFAQVFNSVIPANLSYQDSNLFKTTFIQATRLLKGNLVDQFPLSELRQVNNVNNVPSNVNFIKYLFNNKLDVIKNNITNKQEPSNSLLYLMLRHSQFMQYWDAAMEIFIQGKFLAPETTPGTGGRKLYKYYNGAGSNNIPPHSKWYYLFTDIFGLRGRRNESLNMANYLETDLIRKYPVAAQGLKDFKQSLSVLADLNTAKLERVFVEHLDLCTYRLDAWHTGLTHKHLTNLRKNTQKDKGIYLGAYGYLEKIKPAAKRSDIQGNPIVYGYDEGVDLPLAKAPGNQGYIHGPSLAHAITAAILRNGYITHATPQKPDLMAVDISSERVRKAMFYIEGVRSGQSLSALLGYQYEKALRDKYPTALAMQLHLYELRKLFPIVANKIASTQNMTRPVEAMAADNVLDGLALIEAFKAGAAPFTGNTITLPNLVSVEAKNGLIEEVKNLLEALDGLADLVLAEGVFQLSRGNLERSQAVMDALSQGNKPIPNPEIIETPRSGVSITNRVCLNFEAIAKPTVAAGLQATIQASNSWSTIPMTARALSELSLNKWLGTVISPNPSLIKCRITYAPASNPNNKTNGEIALNELLLQPLDILFILGQNFDIDGDDSELSKLISYYARRKYSLSDEHIVVVKLRDRASNWSAETKNFYEVAALTSNLFKLIAGSKTLNPDDLVLSSSAGGTGAVDNDELYNRLVFPRPIPVPTPPTQVAPIQSVLTGLYQPIINSIGVLVPTPPQKYVATAGALDIIENILIRLTYLYNEMQSQALQPEELDTVRLVMMEAVSFGIPQAIPNSATGIEDADRLSLMAQILDINKIIRVRINKLRETGIHSRLPSSNTAQQNTSLIIEGAKILFDNTINILPLFTLHNPVEIQAAYNQRTQILPSNDPYCIDKWTRGIARVREKMTSYERIATMYDLFGHIGNVNNQAYNQFTLSAVQLSFSPMDFWAAYYYGPDKQPESEVISFMMALPPNFQAGIGQVSNRHVGLLIDDWVEMIPNKEENTGVAIHYDQPNSKAPQTILLAVSPQVTGSWKWDNLSSTVLETMDLAKIRAVEPDHFNKSNYPFSNLFSQLLPGILTEVAKNNTTISTDLSINNNQEIFNS